jgi:hypothetical protein
LKTGKTINEKVKEVDAVVNHRPLAELLYEKWKEGDTVTYWRH